MLDLTAGHPEVEYAAGEPLFRQGDPGGGLWVLVSGVLGVWKDGEPVGSMIRPGSMVGEVPLLLGTDHWVTVRAVEISRVRHVADGRALLDGDPQVISQVAVGLAHRLTSVTGYLADLEHQYGEAPGLAMVSQVVGKLTAHDPPPIITGSVRDPDPEY
jgi:CRP-like cAMP-binding protein